MRTIVLIAVALLITACGQSPMGSTEEAPPPADAPIVVGPDYSGDFDAVGTEPFWNVKVRAAGMTLSRPDHPDVTTGNSGVRIDGEQGVFDAMAGEQRLVLRLTPGDCSDGMSDRHYGYLAEVWIDGETLKGCASKTQDLAAQPKP
ncbi:MULTISPECIES: COG3650 family protein [unclassified Caulobacter]|jgi:uncharacterized membrane protein|uniref:COG3650 family protein n=1 Tax=unclassified Caulobacter TaxID=2648921 RepID=UPI000647203E|nr:MULTISPECIES: membrane protein [unclassified Caulobacter]KQV62046.1 hypothetical protein ASC62_00490 [Caulobacter sp. Root342]KQV64742.1 hypothetical protein ASC70_18930 [Caulobacter sp. Root343]